MITRCWREAANQSDALQLAKVLGIIEVQLAGAACSGGSNPTDPRSTHLCLAAQLALKVLGRTREGGMEGKVAGGRRVGLTSGCVCLGQLANGAGRRNPV